MFWRGSVLVLGLFFSSSFSANACQLALKDLEDALNRTAVSLQPSGSWAKAPRLQGRPLHFTSQMALPFIWVTNPSEGADYAIVRKADEGFGFSPAAVEHYEFLKSDRLFLRSLDFGGLQQRILATLVHVDPHTKQRSLVLKAARVADGTTGQLSPLPGEGLVIDDVHDSGENFVVSPRSMTPEYWITDGSRNVRVVNMSESGELSLTRFEIPEEVQIQGKPAKISEVLKIGFFAEGDRAYIKFKTSDGEMRIALLSIFAERQERKPDELLTAAGAADTLPEELTFTHTEIDFENAVSLPEGSNRSSAHLYQDLVFITYSDRVDVYGISEGLSLRTQIDLKPVVGAYELNGIEFFWEGEWRRNNEGENPRFFGEVKAGLLLWDAERKETRLIWTKIGDSKIGTTKK